LQENHPEKPSCSHSASFNPLFIREKLQGLIALLFSFKQSKEFQSLIHQGKIARMAPAPVIRTTPPVFQSLIHQGKIASGQRGRKRRGRSCGSFNPLFIREKLQDDGRPPSGGPFAIDVSIPYSSGKNCKGRSCWKITGTTFSLTFQSLIHQGKIARPAAVVKMFCGLGCFNPLFIREKLQVHPLKNYESGLPSNVSIPYSSGKNCKCPAPCRPDCAS